MEIKELSIHEISKILNRKYPSLLLDGISYIKPNQKCIAFKNVSYNEWFFQEHFLEQPIMPGTLQIEIYTQAIALPLLVNKKKDSEIPIVLVSIDKIRFYKSVLPGSRLNIEAKIERISRGLAHSKAIGYVDNEIVSACEVIYKLEE